ncbi:MAG: PASTA domain-containing protein [Chitinispirillaceae bacterium]|nr:PASTA domain-containing protein [Chitinispirillaceae bacterium]
MVPKKYYSIHIPVGAFWKIYMPVAFGICCVAFFAGLFFVDLYVMPRIVGINRDMVVVPDVSGISYEQAREKLFGVGLLTEIKSREYDSKIPVDGIIKQYPEPGTNVKKSRRVLVIVSKGEEYAVVPDLQNLTEIQAKNELKKMGFSVGEVEKVYHNKRPKDLVINTVPANRTTISRDMKVDLILSMGPKPTSAEMPNIVGEPLAEAKKKLKESGLRVGKTRYRNDHSLLPGTVISQSVPPGNRVPFESAVNITVSIIR